MSTYKTQQSQSQSPEQKLFQKLYNRKFNNLLSSGHAEKRRIVASQMKAINKEEDDEGSRSSPLLNKKSKSVGSLFPQLREIEAIARSQKKQDNRLLTSSLSKLDIYLSLKNIRREQQLNILFLTQSNAVVSDKNINQKFNQFVAVSQQSRPNNLRALLNLAAENDLTEHVKKRKIAKQQQELKQIVKNMIEEHHLVQENRVKENQNTPEASRLSESEHSQVKAQKQKPTTNIDWVLKQCKKYDKRYRVKKQKPDGKSKTESPTRLKV